RPHDVEREEPAVAHDTAGARMRERRHATDRIAGRRLRFVPGRTSWDAPDERSELRFVDARRAGAQHDHGLITRDEYERLHDPRDLDADRVRGVLGCARAGGESPHRDVDAT